MCGAASAATGRSGHKRALAQTSISERPRQQCEGEQERGVAGDLTPPAPTAISTNATNTESEVIHTGRIRTA